VQIEVGYELNYELRQPTPMLLAVHIHHSGAADLVVPDHLVTSPSVPSRLSRPIWKLGQPNCRARRPAPLVGSLDRR
jgi:hypothetical protein